MVEFFSSAKPLEKDDVLDVFRSVLKLTQLFVAPFGLPPQSSSILGEFVALKDFKGIHRCWEDFVARKVYQIKGVSDDSVAASLQYYLETARDREVVEAMQVNEKAPHSLLHPEQVIELPADCDLDLEELSCAAFLAVATAWKGIEDEINAGICNGVLEGKKIMDLNVIHPSDIGYIVSLLSVSSIKSLLSSLDKVYCPSTKAFYSLSYEQYLALIDLYFTSSTGLISDRVHDLFVSLDCLLDSPSNVDGDTQHVDVREISLVDKYTGLQNGSRLFLRRLQTLGWKYAFEFGEKRYTPSVFDKNSCFNAVMHSPFSHPIVASIAILEDCLASENDCESSESAESEVLESMDKTYLCSMELLDAYDSVMRKLYSNTYGEMKTDQELAEEENAGEHEQDGKSDVLDAMVIVEEAISKMNTIEGEHKASNITEDDVVKVLDSRCNHLRLKEFPLGISKRISASLFTERANCRAKTEDVDGALADINSALLLDPKCASAYRSRHKIYNKIASQNSFQFNETDDTNYEDVLSKSAFDALAAFVLDGSTNILLAGAAEDAAREACRENAKEYFWDRQNSADSDDSSTDDDSSDDCNENDHIGLVANKTDSCQSIFGQVFDLIESADCSADHSKLLDELLHSSAFPKAWLVNSYMVLFSPLNLALDISWKTIESMNQNLDDGIEEENFAPFQHLLTDSPDVDEPPRPQEGDADAFRLLCSVVNSLMLCKNESNDSKHDCDSPIDQKENCDGMIVSTNARTASGGCSESGDNIFVWSIESLSQLCDEFHGRRFEVLEDGTFSERFNTQLEQEEASKSNDTKQKDDNVTLTPTTTPFQDAFSAVCSRAACELTGVTFKWKKTEESSPHVQELGESKCSFQLSADVMEDVASSEESQIDGIRNVSRKIRSRLLSVCGSIAYLCGDAMGGYKCLKTSILLDDDLLDARIKIGSILLEMDELDKAEAQMMEAKHRQSWENDICLDLHLAELHLHRMEYFPAVRILRSTSQRLDFLLQDWDGLVMERKVAEHLAPSIISLHGVAEFRVCPETPVKALHILQDGVRTYPDSISLSICYGEVLGQAGDPAGALKSYAAATNIEPHHPLPYLNASRIYQQLNQMKLSKKHMLQAFEIDSTLSLTLVDIAQFKIQEKRFADHERDVNETPASEADNFFASQGSEDILELAVKTSRHVSEVIDVFTTRQIVRFYTQLGESGLAPVFI